MTLVVVGMPASGKTTVGTLVAQGLGVAFHDSDELIEAATGKLIREIFADEGEAVFRQVEEHVVAEALELGGVLSLGGGAVLSDATRTRLKEHTVVLLEVSVATATRRAGIQAAVRPLLLGDVRSRLQALYDARLPLYEEVATHVVSTERREPAEVAAEIVGLVS